MSQFQTIKRAVFGTCAALAIGVLSTTTLRAQEASELGDKIKGVDERVMTLETSVAKINQLKISGYVQPQWQWADVDSLGNAALTRNSFTIRRGRIKFQHTTDNVYYTLYPDVTENGVILKEAYAGWKAVPGMLDISMGAMNRPFGYEIAYSSSAREVTERSQAENRLFNGERDLGLQFAVTPSFGDMHPLLEMGLFNGSDNFGKGPIVFNSVNYTNAAFTTFAIGSPAALTVPKRPTDTSASVVSAFLTDSTRVGKINASLPAEAALFNGGFRQSGKEFMGHLRLPFLLSDDLSFDIGGSWSMGGINEPSNLRGEYTGTNGALVIKTGGNGSANAFTIGQPESGGFLKPNRTVFGGDAQIYLSMLPIGGSIIKAELYTGHVPFYGTSALFTNQDVTDFGTPRPITVLKNVMGYYAMLIQNITDNFQLAVRYDVFDPNTDVKGTDFVTKKTDTTTSSLRGVTANTGFGGDLQLSTLSVSLNAFVSGALRLMFDFDMPKTEDYVRSVKAGTTASKNDINVVQAISDPHDNRFTFRMQYKF